MAELRQHTLLNTLNAQLYSNWSTEDEPLLGERELIDLQHSVLNINFEQRAQAWEPIASWPDLADDPRLPKWFLDGSVTSVEIAGSARDKLGYPRVIRAGQMGVGATCASPDVSNQKQFWRFIAVNTSGYNEREIAPLRADLRQAEIPHELITWQSTTDQNRETARDLISVRTSVRNMTRDEMLVRERELVAELAEPVYTDGRYADHANAKDSFLVIGVIKSQRARYLSNRPLEVLYSLKKGERTPAFLIQKARGQSPGSQIVTFYVRLTSPNVVGPSGGLVRVELSERYFYRQAYSDFKLLDAIAADLTRLRTRDTTYSRGEVTVEPIRLIERELQLIFRDTQMAALETMRLL